MKRSLKPQWPGCKNLGDFDIEFVGVTADTMETLVAKHSQAFAEFVNAQAHIKFTGATFGDLVREKLEAIHGKPEKGKSEEWHVEHYEEAREIAKELVETFQLDANASLLKWASEWKPAGASVSAKLKALTPEQLAKLLEMVEAQG